MRSGRAGEGHEDDEALHLEREEEGDSTEQQHEASRVGCDIVMAYIVMAYKVMAEQQHEASRVGCDCRREPSSHVSHCGMPGTITYSSL